MVHNGLYHRGTVEQLPEICHMVALQPDRFKGSGEAILPEEIRRYGIWSFT